MVHFGIKLKQLRLDRQLSQKQLAALIGVQNSVISFYEMGDRIPSPGVIKKLAVVLHVSTDYLMGIPAHESVDVSGLDPEDVRFVCGIVEHLRRKNEHKDMEF